MRPMLARSAQRGHFADAAAIPVFAHLRSDSEASVKADQAEIPSIEKLQEKTGAPDRASLRSSCPQ